MLMARQEHPSTSILTVFSIQPTPTAEKAEIPDCPLRP